MDELRECRTMALDLPDGRFGIGAVRDGELKIVGVFNSRNARDAVLKLHTGTYRSLMQSTEPFRSLMGGTGKFRRLMGS